MTGTVTVLLAPAGPLRGVRDVLQDWNALGLVTPFLWLEPGPDHRGVVVRGGRGRGVALDELLADQIPDRIRLCSLAISSDEADDDHEFPIDVAAALAADARGRLDPLRIILARPGATRSPGLLALPEWKNVIISPEDLQGPGLTSVTLGDTASPVLVQRHAAAAVCGLAGLWDGVDDAPLDGRRAPYQPSVRVARAFLRRLDTTAVRERILAGVTETKAGLPLPRLRDSNAVRIDRSQVPGVTAGMAHQVLARHELGSHREPMPEPGASTIGPAESLAMFFGFLGAALRNSPGDWYRATLHKLSSASASALHSALFGSAPSSWEVVVRGVRPDGSVVGLADLARAASDLGRVEIAGERLALPGRLIEPSLWRDFVAGGLTLIDAGERALPAVHVGAELGVIVTPEDVVPSAANTFVTDQTPLAGLAPIEPCDQRGLDEARRQLTQMVTSGRLSASADRCLADLDRWHAEHSSSYGSQIGAGLNGKVTDSTSEVGQILSELQSATEPELPGNDVQKHQKRLSRRLQITLLSEVVILIILGVLRGYEQIDGRQMAIAIAVSVVAWVTLSFAFFTRGQQQLFRIVHARRVMLQRAEINQRNLALALTDLGRRAAVYEQFLCWTRVLGAFLADLGRPGDVAPAATAGLNGSDMPRTSQIGEVVVDDTEIARIIQQSRREVFPAGWLTRPWQHLLADAPNKLGAQAIDLQADPDKMYSEQGSSPSLLYQWSTSLVSGPGRLGTHGWVSGEVDRIIQTPAYAGSLRQHVVSGIRSLRFDEFMAGVGTDPGEESLSRVAFGSNAFAQNLNRIAETWNRSSAVGSAETVVTVQLTAEFSATTLDNAEDVSPSWQLPEVDGEF